MLAIANQTVGPNWLTLFEETQGYRTGDIGYKIRFFQCVLKILRETPSTSVSNNYDCKQSRNFVERRKFPVAY